MANSGDNSALGRPANSPIEGAATGQSADFKKGEIGADGGRNQASGKAGQSVSPQQVEILAQVFVNYCNEWKPNAKLLQNSQDYIEHAMPGAVAAEVFRNKNTDNQRQVTKLGRNVNNPVTERIDPVGYWLVECGEGPFLLPHPEDRGHFTEIKVFFEGPLVEPQTLGWACPGLMDTRGGARVEV